jgi:hypothetical protein
MRSAFRSSVRRAMVTVSIAGLSGCSAHQGASAPSLPRILSPTRSATQAPAGHLYVVSTNASTVKRYPIQRGVVSPTPDKVLNVRDPACSGKQCGVDIYGIDVDAAANLYITVQSTKDFIFIYGPGAAGNAKPRRSIRLPNIPMDVKVDSRGYVYVAMDAASETTVVDVYAPGARGQATPIASISQPTLNRAFAVALSPSDVLYVGGDSLFEKYARARTTPRLVSTICNQIGPVYSLAMASLEGTTWMYAALGGPLQRPGWLYAWQGLRDRPCPEKPVHRIQVAGSPHGRFNAKSVALDAATNTLYASDGADGKVYELNALDFQPQTPMATITQAYPGGIALAR